ncbi:glutathione S-transferase family protein [Labrys neptuniae]
MKLYYSPNSCALAVHVTLEEAKASYQLMHVDFSAQEQRSPWFFALNPLGRVPVLDTGRGILTEVPAILSYIATIFPEARLCPAGHFEAAQLASFNAFVSSNVHVNFAHFIRAERWADDGTSRAAIRSKAVENCANSFRLIDDRKLAGPWVLGHQFTTADPYLFVMTRWLQRIELDVAAYPNIQAHHKRMVERDSVGRALEQEGLV